MRYLELLAPARDLSCGIAAIDHGADAVYIGADRFGARAAAGNSVADIAQLCRYAHRYGAKVYVTVNTIIYENELDSTQQLVTELSEIDVDALLVQDMATLQMQKLALQQTGYAPMLHASTQMDNRSVEKVRWLRSLGFTRAVLARELSLDEIRAVHEAVPDIELEVFVHGALCVSYSGQCYASQHLLHRSANRGECAQMCRMKFDLIDADGDIVEHDRYLLSMKDLCQVDHLEELADAGASSFKIEGRLKGEDYVKNVVSAYNKKLNDIIKRRPNDYCRSSWGKVEYGFTPNLSKTFNRGYTNYFLGGRSGKLCTMFTPKALGEFVGTVKSANSRYFDIKKLSDISNGDGLCFIDDNHELVGFRVNRAEGYRLYPFRMPHGLKSGMSLYRNNDVAFEKTLKGDTTKRKIVVNMSFGARPTGFELKLSAETCRGAKPVEASATVDFEHQKARTPQKQNIVRQLSRLGDTIYEPGEITVDAAMDEMFVPSSILADLRRKAVSALDNALSSVHNDNSSAAASHGDNSHSVASHENEPTAFYWTSEYKKYPYLFNVSNHESQAFYKDHGLDITQPAFEVEEPKDSVMMQCRYCIRYELGYCVKRGGKKPTWREPLTLRLGDGHRFRLEFRCDECQMNIHPM